MTTTNKTTSRVTISLNFPRKEADFLLFATNVGTKMTNNPAFPNPTPSLASLNAAIADLHTAQVTATSRAKGAATVRDEKRTVVVGLLQQARGYVQGVADATPENAASIIESAGFAVRKAPTRGPRAFEARQGAVSGTAKLVAVSAGKRASYEWQYSTDGGKTWIVAPVTLQAKTSVTGLAVGSTVVFRYRAVLKGGEGDWSQTVALLVK